MRIRIVLLLVGIVVPGAVLTHAHHSFSPVYDEGRSISVEGVVTEFEFINPHALMSMDVTDASGKVATWTVEFAGRLNLGEKGWTPQTIKAGERVTVTGNPTHTGSARMFFRGLVRPDGTKLSGGDPNQQQDVEEARRLRRQQRTKQP
jgi:hypothetical protein